MSIRSAAPARPRAFCATLVLALSGIVSAHAQQPTEPVDPTPINGETYYFINQLSGLQMDVSSSAATSGTAAIAQTPSFTSLTQRWAVTKLPSGNWIISNLNSGLCLDSASSGGATTTVENTCAANTSSQQWSLTYTSNGYNVIKNTSTGLALDLTGESTTAGTALDQTPITGSGTQGQLWLLRPVFFRGDDNALLEKEEQLRVAGNLPWWKDAGQSEDVLQILKNQGFNLIRMRPTSIPPYTTYTTGSSSAIPATCTGNGCYAETDAADIDLAKRAKQLGLSVAVSLLFDGGSSSATPGAWSGYSESQAETAIYNYVKAEIEAYRSAGAMPDLVSIGNEVDTGFLSSLGGSPSGSATSTAFKTFAAYETAAMQAVADAASDTSIGPAVPTPLRCIHVTPSWDLSSFFGEVNTAGIPYDAMCQSYYPFFHGPLTAAEATASNPNNQPIEATALTNGVNNIGKPVFIIETAEHYENGFDSNDPWYPATLNGQRQFALDLQAVMRGLPNNLGMGFDYWDAAGTNIPNADGFTAGDGKTDGTFSWNGLTLFDNADTSGETSTSAATYNDLLPAATAFGGKLDPTLHYMLVNAADGTVLGVAGDSTTPGASLATATNVGVTDTSQQWRITGNGDGYFQIANVNSPATPNVLDAGSSTSAGSTVSIAAAASSNGTPSASQEWNILSAGNGMFTIVNRASGMLLTTSSVSGQADTIVQQAPTSINADFATPASADETWEIVPAHATMTEQLAATQTSLTASASSVAAGTSVTFDVTVTNQSSSDTSQPTGTVEFLNGTTVLATEALTGGAASYSTSTLAAGANTVTAVYSGDATHAGSTSTAATVTVTAAPGFTVAISPSSISVAPGVSATATITVTPSGGFSAATTLTCSGAPANSTCTISPSSVTPNGAAVTATLTIATDVSTADASHDRQPGRSSRSSERAALVLAFAFVPLLFSSRKRRLHVGNMVLWMMLVAVFAGITGCGGGSSSSGPTQPTQPVTPAGQSTLTVTAVSGSLQQTATVQLTVQ